MTAPKIVRSHAVIGKGAGMGGYTSEEAVLSALIDLADTLVDGYDVADSLYGLTELCVELVEVDSAGVCLYDAQGVPQSFVATDDQAWSVEQFQKKTGEGPGAVCVSTGGLVVVANLAEAYERWPRFAQEAQGVGFESVHAVPLRLRTETIGTLCLFNTQPGALPERVLRLLQAMADMATVGILQKRQIERGEVVREQLQQALNSRVVIEQAKGMLAQHCQIGVEDAFALLRRVARENELRLSELAHSVVARDVELDTLMNVALRTGRECNGRAGEAGPRRRRRRS